VKHEHGASVELQSRTKVEANCTKDFKHKLQDFAALIPTTKVLFGENPTSMPVFPPQISHEPDWNAPEASAVRGL